MSSYYIRNTSATNKSFHGGHGNYSKVSAGSTMAVTRSRTTDFLVTLEGLQHIGHHHMGVEKKGDWKHLLENRGSLTVVMAEEKAAMRSNTQRNQSLVNT